MKRIIATTVAALTTEEQSVYSPPATSSTCQTTTPNRADILTVAGWGDYSGYENGTFRPDRLTAFGALTTLIIFVSHIC